MSIAQIRSIIQDKPLTFVENLVGDGVKTIFQLSQFPIIPASVNITGGPFSHTEDEDSGTLTFAVALTPYSFETSYKHVLLSDATIQDIIDVEVDGDDPETRSNIRLAAASCLDAIASSQALIQKRIKMLDLETDGPALAEALRMHADRLRDLVLNPKFQEPDFEMIEMINDTPGYLEKIFKDAEREG